MRNYFLKLSRRTLSLIILSTIVVGGASALAYTHLKAKPFKEPPGNQVINVPATSQSTTDTTGTGQPTLPPPTTSSSTTASTPKPPDNTAQCNSILATGEATLSSLNTQINQQLAIMKQIIANEGSGLPSQINGGGVNGLVGNAGIQDSYNQASNEATTLTNQISPDRESSVNQLESLQCWPQAQTMLNYNPSAQ